MRQLFIDTANLIDIREAYEMGVISGVTTNPSIIAKEPRGNYDQLLTNLAKFCGDHNLSLSVEVFATEAEQIFKQGIEIHESLSAYCKDIYIKVPVGVQELKAIKLLSENGVKVNCTCCYTSLQMNMASAAGSKYVSLFYARLKDIGGDPDIELRSTSNFIKENGLDTKIIAGSIRTIQDVSNSWKNGANIVTTSLGVIKNSCAHPQTNSSVSQFMKDFGDWIE